MEGMISMFDNPRYITRGVQAEIPLELQLLLWSMVDTMDAPEKDYLQVFKLEHVFRESKAVQKITHSQEVPPYKAEHFVSISEPFTKKVFIIDDDDHTTMLLADEY
jgi:hypothetical protein